MTRQIFCAFPFDFAFIERDGSVYVCCPAYLPHCIGNLLESSFQDIWNSQRACAIRASILDNSYRFCDTLQCRSHLRHDMLYEGQRLYDPWHYDAVSKGVTHAPRGPKVVLAGYDSTCNFTCPSCPNGTPGHAPNNIETARELQRRVLAEALSNAVEMRFAGMGEPLASPVYLEAIRAFDWSRYPNINIALQTNGSLLTPAMWNSLGNGRDRIRSISVSLNAVTAVTYSNIQRGGCFNEVIDHIRFVRSLRDAGAIDSFGVTFVVQEDNYREMRDFVLLGKHLEVDRVTFSLVTDLDIHAAGPRTASALSDTFRHDLALLLDDPIFSDGIVFLGNLKTTGHCHA